MRIAVTTFAIEHLVETGCTDLIVDGIKRLEAQRDELLAASQWRPIETAPKDGTDVLIYCQVSGAMEAHFEGGEWLDRHNDCREIYVVTHWMPLPNPPSPTL